MIPPISIVSNKYKIVIFTNAKCGFRLCWDIFNVTLGDNIKPESVSNWLYQYDPIKHQDFYKVYIIRNTYERVISAFINTIFNIGDPNGVLPSEKNKEYTFYSFLQKLSNMNEISDVHFIHHTLPDTSIDKIILLENLSTELQNVILNLHSQFVIPESLLSTLLEKITHKVGEVPKQLNNNECDQGTLSNCNWYDLLEMGFLHQIPSYSAFYDTKCKELVDKIYASEILLFNWSFPYSITL